MKTYHLHVDIKGLFDELQGMSDFDFFESWYSSMIDHVGNKLSRDQALFFVSGQLALGHSKYPVAECNNFDYQKGCLGHDAVHVDDPEEIKKCLRRLYSACLMAETKEELSEIIDGDLMDKCAKALGIYQER